jgi:G3E family GTPase
VNAPRIPVTVVGGYLGAGKTTLVNRVLTGDHGRRIAVIVNDFGDVAIDEELMAPATGGVRALANGCVCCAAVDGLATALAEIRALDPSPEHLLIEVSGVGDPWAVAQWGRTPGYELAGVVVLADPEQIRGWSEDRYVGEGVRHQLEVADLVLLSRADVTDEATRNAVESWLATITDAVVVHGTDLPLDLVLGPSPFPGDGPGAGRSSVPITEGRHGDHVARTVWPAPASRSEAAAWLAAAPVGVVRVKGFAPATEDDVDAWFLQRVGRRSEVVRHSLPSAVAVVAITSGAAESDLVESWLARFAG